MRWQSWRSRGIPENPSAWVHKVARNKVLDALRRTEIQRRVTREWAANRLAPRDGIDDLFLDTSIDDSQLRMIFACCHPALARENQIAMTLKTLSGFGISEIARALLVPEETVKKRLQRATSDLVEKRVLLEPPDSRHLIQRLDAVHQVLYLIFNEGYSCSKGERAIRVDLCEDAAHLCYMLCSHASLSTPTTRALMALMLFHAARLDARLDDRGSILLMKEQDRTNWDLGLIRRAREFLDDSAEGTTISVYHLEAGIAFYHATAKSYGETKWPKILFLYDRLLSIHRSPVYLLNRAIVVAEIEGPLAGIRALEQAGGNKSLKNYHLYDATLGEFHLRAGDHERARQYLEAARAKTHSPHDQAIIDRRLATCS